MAEFSWPVRVYYEDTDSGGVVYYANYLKFMERARTEWLRGLGFEQDALRRDEGVIFAVRSVTLDFLQPARFNQLLHVTVKLIEQGRASLGFEQQVRDGVTGTALCSGRVKLACLDGATFKARAIPKTIIAELPGDL
ncbi:MAG: tol-pal system-associated acyl-CoA thioesterase [Gammaproteobacteria bacterium]|nr:tol-pal system-associated acyl-CoA thioesterase [Gammaproteobacteria bacterium]